MYGVIDIGSNTIRLKTYEIKNNNLYTVFDKKNFACLANYVDKFGNLTELGIEKCIAVLLEYKQSLENVIIEKMFIFATASLRNVNNTSEVVKRIKDEVGYEVKILSGTEEAEYDFIGSKLKYHLSDGLMIDIGGGSSELVFFKNKEIIYKTSLPVGSLNLYSKYVDDIIPTTKELHKIKNVVKKYLEEINQNEKWEKICGVGGTIRAALKLKKSLYPNLDNTYLSYDDIDLMISKCKEEPKEWQIAILKVIPERIFTFTCGLMVLRTIMKYYDSKQVYISNYGVREGYLLANTK